MSGNNKTIVQNEGFLYNEEIQKFISDISFTSNVLQKYDNVTYNACLYMFPYSVEKNIEKNSMNGELNFGGHEDRKLIIAQTGLSSKFTIDSIKIQTTYGGNNPLFNGISYMMNINITEVFSCMFTNEIEIASLMFGYKNYMHRPFWLDIWFSGYDPETLMPVERIPLSNNKDKLTYRGVFGNVKSSIKDNCTNWNIEFFSNNHTFVNKNNNILAVSPIKKIEENKISMANYMKLEAEDAKDRYIKTFPGENVQKEVENLFNNNPYLQIDILDGDTNKDMGEIIKSGEGYTREIDKLTSSEVKNSNTEMTFVSLPQWFLARSEGHQNYEARVEFKTKLIGCINERDIYSTNMKVYVFKNPRMTKDIDNFKNKTNTYSLSEDEKTQYFLSFRNKGLLCKKYIYGFSGKDTSVLEVMNNFDRLWYMNGFEYDIKKETSSNINLKKDKFNKIDGETSNNVEDNRNILDKSILLENFYENIKGDILDSNIKKFHFPILNNDLESMPLENTSQSDKEEVDNKTVVSINSYKRLYKSGQLSTTKFKILGDPYWLMSIAENGYDLYNDKFYDSIRTKNYMAENYKCIFGVKNFVGQSNSVADEYSFEYSMFVSGIYQIYKCETELAEGKFTQTLYGTLDPHFIDKAEQTKI